MDRTAGRPGHGAHSGPTRAAWARPRSYAVSKCTGDILVELDHDDLLASTALEEVRTEFMADDGVALVYSDCAQVKADGTKDITTWDTLNGWRYDSVDVDGRDVLGVEALEPTPHNVSYIWFAPNHVRAFARWAYDEAGGYDPDRTVLDDQDLMARLYQAGSFRRIPRVLYLQRVHDGNTQRDPALNAHIQTETVVLYDRHVEANALGMGRPVRPPGVGPRRRARVTRRLPHRGRRTRTWTSRVTCSMSWPSWPTTRSASSGRRISWNTWPTPCACSTRCGASSRPAACSCPARHRPTAGARSRTPPTSRSSTKTRSATTPRPTLARYVPAITARFQMSRCVTYFPSRSGTRSLDISYVQANLVCLKDGGARNGGYVKW